MLQSAKVPSLFRQRISLPPLPPKLPMPATFHELAGATDAPLAVTYEVETAPVVADRSTMPPLGVVNSVVAVWATFLLSVNVSDAEPVLPAASVSLAVIVFVPVASPLGLKDHAPEESAVVVPSVTLPAFRVTAAPAFPLPLSLALVILPLPFCARLMVTAGAALSSVKFSDDEPTLPAMSVSEAVMVWLPPARLDGLKV